MSSFTPPADWTVLVAISGGKDSTALWLHLSRDLGLTRLIPVFADTGWEHPMTYDYLDYLESKLGPLVRLKPERDFVELAVHKKRFPSTMARFCTTELKMKPMREWLKASFANGTIDREKVVQATGIRAEESKSRAQMAEFVATDDYYKIPQWRPIISWTWNEVFATHDKYGIDANPLYKLGMARVGCMPCIMSNMGELAEIARRFPDVQTKIEEAEAKLASAGKPSSFFATGTIPARFCSNSAKGKDGATHAVPTPGDVFSYVQLEKAEKQFGASLPRLFVEPENQDLGTCSSIYGLCE